LIIFSQKSTIIFSLPYGKAKSYQEVINNSGGGASGFYRRACLPASEATGGRRIPHKKRKAPAVPETFLLLSSIADGENSF
jgi:hypothetical protein